MQIVFDFSIKVLLSQREYNLIGQALSRKLKPEDHEEAIEINKRLLTARIVAHKEHLRVAEGALATM